MFALALLIVALIALIINVALCPTIQERDYQRRFNEEEAEREAVNAILQAYLDGLEKGLSLLRQADYDFFDDIDEQNDDTKNSSGE